MKEHPRQATALVRLCLLALAVASVLLVAACGDDGGGNDDSGVAAPEALVQPPADLVRDGTLTVGTDFQFPPYEAIENGEKVGFDVDFAELLGEVMGLDIEMVDTRFSALIPGLQAHQYDAILSALYITPERLKEVDMIPYFNTGNVIVVREDGDYQPKVPLDMCGRVFSINSGAFVEGVVREDLNAECEEKGLGSIEIQSLPTDTANFQQISQGRSDVTLGDTAVTAWRLENTPQLGLHVSSEPGDLFYPTPGGIAVLKDNPDVLRALTEAVEALEQDGSLDALREEYALAPPDPEQIQEAVEASEN